VGLENLGGLMYLGDNERVLQQERFHGWIGAVRNDR
jgi:hypothetical protein